MGRGRFRSFSEVTFHKCKQEELVLGKKDMPQDSTRRLSDEIYEELKGVEEKRQTSLWCSSKRSTS